MSHVTLVGLPPIVSVWTPLGTFWLSAAQLANVPSVRRAGLAFVEPHAAQHGRVRRGARVALVARVAPIEAIDAAGGPELQAVGLGE